MTNNFVLLDCPHCGGTIQVNTNEINCGIFRHAVIRKTGQQVNPHLSKVECDKLGTTVYGCGKPFRIVKGATLTIEKCDYI